MPTYAPVLSWAGQKREMRVQCLTCDWSEREGSVAIARLHSLAFRTHVVALVARTTTHVKQVRGLGVPDGDA